MIEVWDTFEGIFYGCAGSGLGWGPVAVGVMKRFAGRYAAVVNRTAAVETSGSNPGRGTG